MAATSVTRLREALGALLQFYPLVLRNVFQSPTPSSTADTSNTDAAPPTHAVASHDANHMADAVEGFLSELTRALSVGLGEGDGFELWSVLELLECVPDRMQAVAEAEASAATHRLTRSPAATAGSVSASTSHTPPHQQKSTPPHPASSGSDQRGGAPSSSSSSETAHLAKQGSPAANTWQQHLSRFRFASQLVYVVRSSFPAAPRSLQARILLRLALNQGCLLAALELLRQWCRTELEGFYSCSSDEGALLTQPSSDSDVWNAFVAAIAPVAGPPVVEIAAGAPKTAAQAFHLQLVVAGLDDDSAASRAYYAQLQSYAHGRRGTRPSALACYEATLQRRANGPVTTSVEPAAAAAAVSRPKRRAAAPPAQQHALTVEALPVMKEGWAAAARGEHGGGITGSASVIARSSSVSGQQQQQRQRHRRRRRRRSRVPAGEDEEAAGDVAADSSSSHRPRSCSSTSHASHHYHLPTQTHHPTSFSSSTSTSSTRSLSPTQIAPQRESAPPASRHLFEVDGGAAAAVLPSSAHDAVMETTVVFPSYVIPDVAASAPGVSRSFSTAGDGHHTDSGVTSTALPQELQDLRRRVLRCWSVAVKHAESQERKRLGARDADANDDVAAA